MSQTCCISVHWMRQTRFVKIGMIDPSVIYSIEIHTQQRQGWSAETFLTLCALDFAVNKESNPRFVFTALYWLVWQSLQQYLMRNMYVAHDQRLECHLLPWNNDCLKQQEQKLSKGRVKQTSFSPLGRVSSPGEQGRRGEQSALCQAGRELHIKAQELCRSMSLLPPLET